MPEQNKVFELWEKALNEQANRLRFKDWDDYIVFCDSTKAKHKLMRNAYKGAAEIFEKLLFENYRQNE